MKDFKQHTLQIHELFNRIGSQNGEQEKLTELLKNIEDGFQNLNEEKSEIEMRLEDNSRQLRHSQQALQEFDKIKNEFVSTCAHDLKSPTNSILSFIDILNSDGERLSVKERINILNRMDRAGRHMLDLINDLLDMVQIESGKFKINPEPTLMSQLCKEALSNAKGSLNSKEITSELKIEKGELRVKLDPQKAMQIINNLLSNAMKFTPRKGKINILIYKKNKMISMEIKDSGQGIAEEELNRIFEKFQKTSTQATEGEKGSGLGLTIVKQLTDLHNGKIEVKSKVGDGTSFIVSFPVAENPVLLKIFSGKK